MPVYKCRMCGADLEVNEGDSVVECSYCRSTQAVPNVDDEKLLKLFARANKLLRVCEFDKAAGVYEQIVAEDDASAEAYWGLFLCRYGIEYVDEPAGGKKPTLHRASFENVMDDEDLELACESADPTARRLYRDQAKEIERIRRRITEVSGAEEPYDVFICYKETDPVTGERTFDSVLAQDVYKALEDEGYRTFFSRVTLEGKLGLDYEPYIFAALNSAKVMLVIGTNYDHFDAVWVKNEWSRFLRLMEKEPSKQLIPCYKGIDAYDMPSEFARLQGQDMGKIGAIQDLLHGIEKLLGGKAGKKGAQSQAQQMVSGGPQNEALLERARMALEDGEWNRVGEFCEQVLNNDARCAYAYLYKLMAKLECRNVDFLATRIEPFDDDADCRKAIRFGNEELKKKIEGANEAIRERNREKQKADTYKATKRKHKEAITKDDYIAAIQAYKALGDYEDAAGKAKACEGEWAQIEERAKALCDGYVPPARAETKVKETEPASVAAAREAKLLENKLSSLESLKSTFPSVKVAYDAACEYINAIDAEVAKLESERKGCGLFQGTRKKAIASEVERLTEERTKQEILCNKLQGEMHGFVDAEQIDSKIAEANVEMVAAQRREVEARASEEAEKENACERENERVKKQVHLKTALGDPKALLQAETYKTGILDSMNGDSAVWPLIKNTPYLYYKTARESLISGRSQMGTWRGEPLKWRMLKKEDGKALLICTEVVESKPYNSAFTNVTWAECDLRKWLNGEFFQAAFSAGEQGLIVATKLKNPGNGSYGAQGGADTTDKVFCLSINEVESLFKSDSDRKCKPSAHVEAEGEVLMSKDKSGANWWLRSPGDEQGNAASVSGGGHVYEDGWRVNIGFFGVRPAFWLNLES